MQIYIKENEGHEIHLRFPARLAFNSLTASVAPGILQKHGISLEKEQVVAFYRVLHTCRKRHKNWKLLQMRSSDGDVIEIVL